MMELFYNWDQIETNKDKSSFNKSLVLQQLNYISHQKRIII